MPHLQIISRLFLLGHGGFNNQNQISWVAEKWKLLAAQSSLPLCDPMDCSLPGSSVHGILLTRILEWVAISFSRGPWLEEHKRSPFLEFIQDQTRTCPAEWAGTGSGENIKVVLWVHWKRLARSLPQGYSATSKFQRVLSSGLHDRYSKKEWGKEHTAVGDQRGSGGRWARDRSWNFSPSSSSTMPPRVRLRQTNNGRNSFCYPEFRIRWGWVWSLLPFPHGSS